MDKDKRIAELEAQLAQAEMKLDRTTALFIKAEAKLGRLEKEAWSTVNELRGSLGAYENELRTIMGNTNFHCLEFRRDNLAHILSDQPKVLAVVEEICALDPQHGHCTPFTSYDIPDDVEKVTIIVLGKEDS